MKEIRYFFVPDAGKVTELPQEEAKHALKVLRLTSGDEINLMDGEGNFYRAEVSLASSKHCLYQILRPSLNSLPGRERCIWLLRLRR